MPPCFLKPLVNGLLLGKVLAAGPATLPIKIGDENSFQSGLLEDINKAIKSCARTITKIKLSDKVPSDIVLWKAGLPSVNQAVSKCMASLIWKARNKMNPLGHIFETSKAHMNTRAAVKERLSSSVPGHHEAASTILANLWNTLDLKSARSVTAAKALAKDHFKSA